ncbi:MULTISPECIES: exodeoxyribonuclease VII large subunit [unclassified Breznakia]|uniref:exodeoxyribonuclease VII large subunit n=1 Tax=unclassified Breznakia TaxID=2623764 RepID=UPI0024764A14|nr:MULTISPECIES: exodeoxyribonuclease VII large subunit [unclassified Breznakia]MDH6366357.1 exodeoxyribonuclease VII large subunit [Breznakia sp. PH1-1]MDH6403450.1 exodeoxyribonuclease VII large subunit [Breznakia sp. PF1-11]MDH6411159.1 exodeoxyribonuclease VII large subunit [Breznakia sp. PFB1-11]MDH6413578.1 exodeoxyribonuclease VII large subunit [Breznakia sp. PFB1-14]MDH6415704.1 exodeoxyribonuclease VII large subunit [Breznakia sp. PFB1-4]
MSQVVELRKLAAYVKRAIDGDPKLRSLYVKGEISNFTHHRSGHMYFSLKDQNVSMSCVMFASHTRNVKFQVREGMQVIVLCSVSMYEARGSVQLYVTNMQSDGEGDLYLRLEQLKAQLHKEGLFAVEHKKQIPTYPMDIAIISAKTGAAIQDVFSIIERRWPAAKVKLYPSLVQGEQAASNIIQNLRIADQNHHEVILLVRGGGSIEDLWCFNDEMLARQIHAMQTPIVTGVGHETDTTLVDYVSDLRAPTPSAAAEIVTPDIHEVEMRLQEIKARAIRKVEQLLLDSRSELLYYQEKPLLSNKDALTKDDALHLQLIVQRLSKSKVYYERNASALIRAKERLYTSVKQYSQKQRQDYEKKVALLDAYSPLKILNRGYAVTFDQDDHVIKSVNDVHVGQDIHIRLQDGEIKAKVEGETDGK